MRSTKFHVSAVSFDCLSRDLKKRHFRSSICQRLRKCHILSTQINSVRRAEDAAILHFVLARKLTTLLHFIENLKKCEK
jgi:hypothetical protein